MGMGEAREGGGFFDEIVIGRKTERDGKDAHERSISIRHLSVSAAIEHRDTGPVAPDRGSCGVSDVKDVSMGRVFPLVSP